MKQVYVRSWSEVLPATPLGYIYSKRISPGKILHVHNCFAYTSQASTDDIIHIGVVNGGQKTAVHIRKCAAQDLGLSALNDFFVGEGDQVYGYFPDAVETHTIELHVVGVIYSLDEWRKMTE